MDYICKNKEANLNTDLCELKQCKECKKESKIKRLKNKAKNLKTVLYAERDISKSFYGGLVGFKKGAAKRKHENGINREIQQYRDLKDIEAKINILQNPMINKKAVLLDPKILNVGQKKYWFGVLVEIVKINKNTVTIMTSSGYKEAVKPHLLD